MIALTGKRTLAALGAAFAMVVLAGCAGGQQTSVPGAINTGTYPNLNLPPQSAAEPISAGEKAALYGQIGAAKNSQAQAANASPPNANPQLLRKIAASHANDTLEEIEGQK